MIVIDYSSKEFINQLTNVHWERLLATLILIAYSFKSRLACDELSRAESRSHKPRTNDDVLLIDGEATRNPERVTRNPEHATRYLKPAHGSEHRTLNPACGGEALRAKTQTLNLEPL